MLCQVLSLCTCLGLLTAPTTIAPNESIWEKHDPEKLREKYEAVLMPREGFMTGTNIRGQEPGTISKNFFVRNVGLSEKRLAEILDSLQVDYLDLIKINGAQVVGKIRDVKVDGLLREFEFEYRNGKIKGIVRGELRLNSNGLCWNLECLVREDYLGNDE